MILRCVDGQMQNATETGLCKVDSKVKQKF